MGNKACVGVNLGGWAKELQSAEQSVTAASRSLPHAEYIA